MGAACDHSREGVGGMTFSCTLCASPAVMAVAPGSEPERGDLLSALAGVPLSPGAPVVCRCLTCFLARYADGAIATRTAGAVP
jgi:hypothetical protein